MINNNTQKPDCLCEERKCVICKGKFWVAFPNAKGRKLSFSLRPRNCVTCSPSCSRKNLDNYNRAKKGGKNNGKRTNTTRFR